VYTAAPRLLHDVEVSADVEQDFLSDRVSCAGIATESVGVVGLSAFVGTRGRFSDEYGALGTQRLLYEKMCVPQTLELTLIKQSYKLFYLIYLSNFLNIAKRKFF